MIFRPLNTSNSTGQNYGQINDMVRTLNKEQQVKVFKGANNTNALINGKLPNDLGYGLQLSDSNNIPRIIAYIDSSNAPIFKISASGVDVTTATDAQLIFNSNQNVFKIVKTGTYTMTHPVLTGTTIATVAHGLAIIPSFLAFVSNDGGLSYDSLPYIGVTPVVGNMTVSRHIFMSVDATSMYFTIKTPTDNAVPLTRTIKYYLLQETAN